MFSAAFYQKPRKVTAMKMIIAIVNRMDSPSVEDSLLDAGFYITRLATTGGFLKSGNTTFISAVEDDKLDEAIELIRKNSVQRLETVGELPFSGVGVSAAAFSTMQIPVGGATVIVTPIEKFIKL